MKLNLFQPERDAAAPDRCSLALLARENLMTAMFGVLESLPHSYSGRENILLLCDAILAATPQLRLVWIGFQGIESGSVKPYAAAGACAIESADWRLPADQFAADGPFTQNLSGDVVPTGHDQLFAPWRHNPIGCSVECGLAIPLRSEKTGLSGLIVFYADSRNFFSEVGVPIFQAFSHLAEIIWKQSNLMHMASEKAQLDSLTGLMNRHGAVQQMELAILAAEKTGDPFSIFICRLEEFGKLNELYGWLESDAILAALAQEIGARLGADSGGRWTTTEFIYFLRGTDRFQAQVIATDLRSYFQRHPVTVKSWSVRLSVAVGGATSSNEMLGVDDLIQQARQNAAQAPQQLPASDRSPSASSKRGSFQRIK